VKPPEVKPVALHRVVWRRRGPAQQPDGEDERDERTDDRGEQDQLADPAERRIAFDAGREQHVAAGAGNGRGRDDGEDAETGQDRGDERSGPPGAEDPQAGTRDHDEYVGETLDAA